MFGRNLVVATAVNANPVLIFSSSLRSVARQNAGFLSSWSRGCGGGEGGFGQGGRGHQDIGAIPSFTHAATPGSVGRSPPASPRAPPTSLWCICCARGSTFPNLLALAASRGRTPPLHPEKEPGWPELQAAPQEGFLRCVPPHGHPLPSEGSALFIAVRELSYFSQA